MLLDWGLESDDGDRVERSTGTKSSSVEDGALIACFDDEVDADAGSCHR